MGAQRLIFGIGAAKSGTSWLWDYLYSHPETHFSAVKELHYFDAIETPGRLWARKALERSLSPLVVAEVEGKLAGFKADNLRDGRGWIDAFDGQTRDDAAYLDYIGLGRVDAPVVGDFTPSYALLKEQTYREMAALAPDARFIFLMRDPVARLWSNVRMGAGKSADAAGLETALDEVLAGDERSLTLRSNYRRTLNRLLKVVPREAVFIEFYERLFQQDTIDRLTDFLGISRRPASFDRVVHKGRDAPMPANRVGQTVEFLRPQYNFVERLVGDLPAEWTEQMVMA